MTQSLKANYSITIDNAKPAKPEQLPQNEISKAVNALKPSSREISARKDREMFSRKLKLAKQSEQLTVVCPETGLVGLMDLPACHGYALTYLHPLSVIENARGVAQRGKDYLRKLDTQVLAGILITIANDYNLFHYQPSDSGAQKNSLVRMIHRDTIIMAILLIECSVHSSNYSYLPRFSMLMETEFKRGELDTRFQLWMQLITEAIYKPDELVYDENETVQSKLRKEQQLKSRVEREADSALRKKQRELQHDCKKAASCVKDLYKAGRISPKLRATLLTIYQEFQLLSMDSGARMLLISKLDSIAHPAAALLAAIAKKDRTGLAAKNTPLDDFFNDAPPSIARVIKTDATVQVIDLAKPPELIAPEGSKVITIGAMNFIVETEMYSKLSFLERVKFHKSLVAGESK